MQIAFLLPIALLYSLGCHITTPYLFNIIPFFV